MTTKQNKQTIDKDFTKLLSNQMLNAKGFYDYGVKNGLTTPEALRLTVAKRQETAKALIESGMSQREAAKVLGVSQKTISNDVSKNSSKSEEKVVTNRSNASAGEIDRAPKSHQQETNDADHSKPDEDMTPAEDAKSALTAFQIRVDQSATMAKSCLAVLPRIKQSKLNKIAAGISTTLAAWTEVNEMVQQQLAKKETDQ